MKIILVQDVLITSAKIDEQIRFLVFINILTCLFTLSVHRLFFTELTSEMFVDLSGQMKSLIVALK